MRKENALDFGDLTRHTIRLLQSDPRIAEELGFRYVLVDEYQDACPVEAELVRLLSFPHGNLCVVGDPRQSIYGWRGSDPRLILDFQGTCPDARKHVLDTNYRSARGIVGIAEEYAQACEMAGGYSCCASRGDDGHVSYHSFASEDAEAEWIAASIRRMLEAGLSPSEIAILCRTHALCVPITEALTRHGIRYGRNAGPGVGDVPATRSVDDASGGVRVMTIHAAKGLEFPVVIVPGLVSDGTFERVYCDDDTALQEERRLLYVAMTRAADRLYLTSPRRWQGIPH